MLEKIQTYVDNYVKDENKKIMDEYLFQLGEFNNYKNASYKSKNKNDYTLSETKDEYNIKYKKIDIKLKKPVYKNIFDEINILKNKKKNKKLEYDYLQYRILYNLNSENEFNKYNKLVDELQGIDNEIKDLIECYILINKDNKIKVDYNTSYYKKLKEEQKELYDKIINENSDLNNKNNIDNYIKLKNEQFEITDNTKNNQQLKQVFSNYIDYIIIKLPEIIKTTSKQKKTVKKEKKLKEKISLTDDEKLKEQNKKLIKKINDKLQKIDKDKINRIEKKILDKMFKEFKFKNEEECGSRASSADYFIKKPDLVKIIKKYPEVEKLMSSNYNKLSKDKICKELFQIENIETKLQEPNDKVTSEEKKFIDELLKDKDILFKDEKECASRAHSTDYFMKKTDLIKIIKKYPEIEKLLPNDYSKFNKTKLCNELFKI
jgi:hypothetical protein